MKTKRLKPKLSYSWKLATANFTKDKGSVFECFSSGGGSTMGYKLAGFDVIGCNEIDKRMMEAYITNHNPKYSFLESISTFKLRNDLPEELYNLDILSGSPPCSTFSLAGLRGKAWGEMRSFKEGKAKQILDTLFFDFIDLANKLQPKMVVAENVKGLIQGKAIKYLERIYKELDQAGYIATHYLLDSSKMGVPQKRERVFIIGIRKDLAKPFIKKNGLFDFKLKLDLKFNEKKIPLNKFAKGKPKTTTMNYLPDRFGDVVVDLNKPCPTLVTVHRYWIDENTILDDDTIAKVGTFPLDYKYPNKNKLYIIAMSVPPIMIAKISLRLHEQILSKIKDKNKVLFNAI